MTSNRKAFFRKPTPPETPVGPDSCVLVRVGTACDQMCIMCPNPTGSERSYLPTPEVTRRVDFVASLGFWSNIFSFAAQRGDARLGVRGVK